MSLFQTDAWQRAWWQTWGEPNNLRRVADWGNDSNGLYLSRYRLKGLLPVSSLEFVGCSYRLIRSVRTEYNRLPLPPGTVYRAPDAIRKLLCAHRWSEAVLNDLYADSDEVAALRALAEEKGWRLRETAADTAWQVETVGSFGHYLKSLGRNTRLRLFNRRKVLEELGPITLENAWEGGRTLTGDFFEQLNHFHRVRWGKRVFGPVALGFHRDFLERVVAEGAEPQLSVLRCDGRLISVLYNVRYQGCVYNIQSGFEEALHSKLSLGILHLGYAIEAAFEDPEVTLFDMLAGNGKNTNYKERLATRHQELVSLMLVRNPLLKLLYAARDRGE